MFNIRIDKELLAYLAEKRLRIDELFVVMCFMLGKVDLIKVLLGGRTGDQCTAFMQALERKGLMRKLAPMVVDFDWDNYGITEVGNDVYEDCLCSIVEDGVPGYQVITTEPDDMGDLVKDFLALWPDGVKNQHGDRLKSHEYDVTKKMKEFVKKYKFTRTEILSATERYLEKQRRDGYAFCNQAMYFISKGGVSKLASQCGPEGVEDIGAWENVM